MPLALKMDDKNELYVADPVTAPGSAGLLRTVLTENWLPRELVGPKTSTSTICQSGKLKKYTQKLSKLFSNKT